ncbi:MAG: tail protein X [Vibrio sp.]
MAKLYRTRDGDVLDEICYREYGTSNAVIAVLEANPRLADQGAYLPSGLLIKLPEYTPPAIEEEVTLWS